MHFWQACFPLTGRATIISGNDTDSNLCTALLRRARWTDCAAQYADAKRQAATGFAAVSHFMEDCEDDPTRLFWYFIVRSELNCPKVISIILKFAPLGSFVMPNASAHLLPEAAARNERRLEAVRLSVLLDTDSGQHPA